MKPRVGPLNLPMLGNTSGRSADPTPYHVASVARVLFDGDRGDPSEFLDEQFEARQPEVAAACRSATTRGTIETGR